MPEAEPAKTVEECVSRKGSSHEAISSGYERTTTGKHSTPKSGSAKAHPAHVHPAHVHPAHVHSTETPAAAERHRWRGDKKANCQGSCRTATECSAFHCSILHRRGHDRHQEHALRKIIPNEAFSQMTNSSDSDTHVSFRKAAFMQEWPAKKR